MLSTSTIWEDLERTELSAFFKGMPLKAQNQTVKEFLSTSPNLFSAGFQYPIAILKKASLDNNLRRMAEFCEDAQASLAPHAKTTMAPQIARMQIEHGAWALTVANFSQARVFLEYGFKRIIIANEIADYETIREIALRNLGGETEIFFYLDSIDGLKIVQNALLGLPEAKIHLLFEIGVEGGRGGVRSVEHLMSLADRVKQDPRLIIRGVSGFEGAVPGGDRTEAGLQRIREFCKEIVEAARSVRPYVGREEIILSAGGSAYFDIVAEEFRKFGPHSHLVLRSGAYISHDHGMYETIYPFARDLTEKHFFPAIELWAQVISQPEPGLAILNLGKRDVGNDIGNPIPVKRWRGKIEPFTAKINQLNDQHGYMHFDPNENIAVGDVIGMGISHPCTTFDKWKLMPLVDEDYGVVDLIHTYF